MTSNVASQYFSEEGISKEGAKRSVLNEIKATFRPEFINRIDELVLFNKLTKPDIRGIVELQLKTLLDRLSKQGMAITVDDKAKDELSKEGFDPVYGARPLHRVIQKKIQDVVALKLLKKEFKQGDKIKVSYDGKSGEYKFSN